jgi:phosphatidylserine/phosphatidylglycerophosphate/cardiolipin synthase-like enzyme
LLQKLLHPQSRHGYVYPPSSWPSKLGLPDAALLEAGAIQLRVKSLFFLPFSVLHPKFLIVDRQRAFVPSCNVSWEAWLEGCVEITGDAVQALMSFYSLTWEEGSPDFRHPLSLEAGDDGEGAGVLNARQAGVSLIPSTAHYLTASFPGSPATLPTLVLPSTYHQNPHFHPLPWQKHPPPPPTPLNIALLQLFEQARRAIYIQTPNLTCKAVIHALLDALKRGVDVTIVTSRNMMLLEQLVTAGTTTSWCIGSLVRRFRRLRAALHRGDSAGTIHDLEAGRRSLGRLHVSYFRARSSASSSRREGRPLISGRTHPDAEEPVHSHLKLTIVDGEYTVLGSGNMDRASWYTSQELGVLFHGGAFARTVKVGVDSVLEGRLELVFDSEGMRD